MPAFCAFLGFLLASGCSVLDRNNPVDPGATNVYRPHFRKLIEIPNMTNVSTIWAGTSNIIVQGWNGSELRLERYDYGGVLQKSSNHFLPSAMGGSPRIMGLETPGTNYVLFATNQAIITYDFNFIELSTKVPYGDGSKVVDMAAIDTATGPHVFVSRNIAPFFLNDGKWSNFGPISVPFNEGPWIGVVRGSNAALDLPSELVAVTRQFVPSANYSLLNLVRYDATNGAAILENAVFRTGSTNVDGIAYNSLGGMALYAGQVYFHAVSASTRPFLRQRRGKGLEWVLLDPDPAVNVSTFHISESGKLIIAGGDRILVYVATGD
jgi:hypothetical protein